MESNQLLLVLVASSISLLYPLIYCSFAHQEGSGQESLAIIHDDPKISPCSNLNQQERRQVCLKKYVCALKL